jgi:predicted GNAT family acetyltransferase
LSRLIGAETAEKLLRQAPDDSLGLAPVRSLLDLDLSIGGEGMKGFYDNILPKSLDKIGKKYGTKVRKTMMDTPEGPVEVWAMDIPPEMRETISSQGQPLFQIGAGAAGAGTAGTMLSSDEETVQNFRDGGEVQPYMGDYVFPNRPRNYVSPSSTTSAEDLKRFGKQAGLVGLGFAPGAGMADYFGQFPAMEGGTEPSAVQNFQQGNYGTAALQGLGAMGDLMYAVPVLGATVGSAMKGPRAAQRMLRELSPESSLKVSATDASNLFGQGAQRLKYQDPDSGGFIDVLVRPDGTASVVALEVPEQFRKQGIGEKLQAQVMQDFPVMQGQVSSKAAATTAYRLGRRPVNQPDATLDDVFKMIEEDSSVNLVSPQALSRATDQGSLPTETKEFKNWAGDLPIYPSFKEAASDRGVFKLYHATPEDFQEFVLGGKSPKESGKAIWLSPDPSSTSAAFRVGSESRGFKEGANIRPVYTKIARPLVIDDKPSMEWAQTVYGESQLFPQVVSDDAIKRIKEDGYDSVVFKGEQLGWGKGSDEILAFEQDQIKSAFDPAMIGVEREVNQ